MLADEVDFPSWDFNIGISNDASGTGVASDSVMSSVRNVQIPLPEAQTLISVKWPIGDDDAKEKSNMCSDAPERNEFARAEHQEIVEAGGLEIVLFWTKSSRPGGNLGVCPRNHGAIVHLIKSHLVCEIVHSAVGPAWLGSVTSYLRCMWSKDEKRPPGILLGVELGECSISEQSNFQELLRGYSFFNATMGLFSLLFVIFFFNSSNMGLLNLATEENAFYVLTALAVAVAAELHEEATWPWVLSQLLVCAKITKPIERINRFKRVKYWDSPYSGQAFLTSGLGAFGVWLDVSDEEKPADTLPFRVAVSVFSAAMALVLVVNMVQAMVAAGDPSSRDGQDRVSPLLHTFRSSGSIVADNTGRSSRSRWKYLKREKIEAAGWSLVLIVCGRVLVGLIRDSKDASVATYMAAVVLGLGVLWPCVHVCFPDDDDGPSFARRALWYCLGAITVGLEGLLVSVAIAVALGSVIVGFALRAVFDVSKGLRASLGGNLFWIIIVQPTKYWCWVALGFTSVFCASAIFLKVFEPEDTEAIIAAVVPTVTVVGTGTVFVLFAVEITAYVVMLLVFAVADFALRAFSRVHLMSLVSCYDGALACRLGTMSIEVEDRSMAKLIQAEIKANSNHIDGYDYQMIGEQMSEVSRVGRKAVVMMEDEDDQQIKSLTCSYDGHRAIR